jgi:hypothetical protein
LELDRPINRLDDMKKIKFNMGNHN